MCYNIFHADMAQLVEQLIRNEQVVGSSPTISSIQSPYLWGLQVLQNMGFPIKWKFVHYLCTTGIKKASRIFVLTCFFIMPA